jgi:hypothetical protein
MGRVEMKDLQAMLEEKEAQLAQLQKEVDALRLVANMFSTRSESKTAPIAEVRPAPQAVASPAQPVAPEESYMPAAIMRGAASAAAYASPSPLQTNGGTKRFP